MLTYSFLHGTCDQSKDRYNKHIHEMRYPNTNSLRFDVKDSQSTYTFHLQAKGQGQSAFKSLGAKGASNRPLFDSLPQINTKTC